MKTKSIGRKRSAFIRGMIATTSAMAILVAGPSIKVANAQDKTVRIPSAVVVTLSIPPQSLNSAILAFADKTGVQVFFDTARVQGLRSGGARGQLTAEQALTQILAGTGMSYRFTGPNSATINAGSSTAPTSDQGATDLKPITVRGAGATSDPNTDLPNPSTAIGSKTPLAQRDIPQTVSVVTQQKIQQQNVQTLDEALKRAPGITVLQSDASRFQYYARGFPISSVQVDGLPTSTNPNLSQTSSTGAPNLAMYDRIELLDGPAGLYNGLGGPGGVVNLVRKRAPYAFSASTELGIGSGGDRRAMFDVGGPINPDGTVRARIVGDLSNGDLVQDGTWKKDRSVYGTIEADLTPDTLLRLGASYSRRTQHATWSGNPIYTDNTVVGDRSHYFGADWNREVYDTTDVFASIEHTFDNDWKLQASGDYSYLKNSITQSDIYTLVDPATDLATIGSDRKDGSESNKSFDVFTSGPVDLLGRTHQLTVGANYSRMDERQTSYYGAGGDDFNSEIVNVFDFNYAKPVWLGLPSDTDENRTHTSQVGIYGNARLSITDPLSVILGGRVTWWHSTFEPDAVYNYDNYSATADSYNAKFSPYAGAVYKLNETYSLYGSYSSIFQPQTLRTSTNAVIAPIEGDQFEAGIKGEFFDGGLTASAALFQITQKNRGVLDPRFPLDYFYVAQGRARTRGIDLRVSGEAAPGFTIYGGYTYNNSKYLDVDSYDTLASTFSQIAPTHLFKIWGNYQLPGRFEKWEVGTGVNVTSELYAQTDTGRITQPGYITVDARLAYNVNDKMTVALNGTNIFDRKYYQPGSQAVVWGEPAKVMLTVRAKY